MNTENLKNVSASVHQRLLNKARESSRPFNELLQLTAEQSIFEPSFVQDKSKNQQWQGFIRKAKLVNAPETFEEVVEGVRGFLVCKM